MQRGPSWKPAGQTFRQPAFSNTLTTKTLAKYLQALHKAGMAKAITIRNVPDDVRDELAARAARSGRSLQEYLRAELIEVARRQDIGAIIARARHRVERTQSELTRDEILEHLDEDRP